LPALTRRRLRYGSDGLLPGHLLDVIGRVAIDIDLEHVGSDARFADRQLHNDGPAVLGLSRHRQRADLKWEVANR
jgi:hypothetical protein